MPPQRFEYQPCIISQFKGPHLHEVGIKRCAAHESGTLRLASGWNTGVGVGSQLHSRGCRWCEGGCLIPLLRCMYQAFSAVMHTFGDWRAFCLVKHLLKAVARHWLLEQISLPKWEQMLAPKALHTRCKTNEQQELDPNSATNF